MIASAGLRDSGVLGGQGLDRRVRPALSPTAPVRGGSPACALGTCAQDPQDQGPAYRNVIGIPGGVNSPLFPIIQVGCWYARGGLISSVPITSCYRA